MNLILAAFWLLVCVLLFVLPEDMIDPVRRYLSLLLAGLVCVYNLWRWRVRRAVLAARRRQRTEGRILNWQHRPPYDDPADFDR